MSKLYADIKVHTRSATYTTYVLNLQFIVCKQYINAMSVCAVLEQVIGCATSFVVHRKQSVAGVSPSDVSPIFCKVWHTTKRSLVLWHGLICNFDIWHVVVGTAWIYKLTWFEWQAFLYWTTYRQIEKYFIGIDFISTIHSYMQLDCKSPICQL